MVLTTSGSKSLATAISAQVLSEKSKSNQAPLANNIQFSSHSAYTSIVLL
jgi:hypothetical protein